jgi:hypothetical protein
MGLALGMWLGGCDDDEGAVPAGGPDAGVDAPRTDGADAPGDLPSESFSEDRRALDEFRPDHGDSGAIEPPQQLDLVFVIDNSLGMKEAQESLQRGFPSLIAQLQRLPGGLPDLRIAFLSSNFGAGSSPGIQECDNYGDRGSFQVRPACGLAADASWLALAPGSRNFTGELPAALGCLAGLGTGGCGYEHHLQSLRAAFSVGVAPQNAGFLRARAHLGIVILADEDDCSADPSATLFVEDIAGQVGGLRCALRGHTCNGQPVPATAGFSAPLSACQPAVHPDTYEDRRDRLINLSTFVADIKGLKDFPDDQIVVSAIIGWNDSPTATYSIASHSTGTGTEVDLGPICTRSASWTAAPGIRLNAFARSFRRHTVHSICAATLDPAMTEIGHALTGLMAAP